MRNLSGVFVLAAALHGQDPQIDFVRDVAPILQQRCVACHGADKQKGDLRLDRKEDALPAEDGSIVPGDVDASEFLRRIGLPDGDDERMPNEGERLSKQHVETLTNWIRAGAAWPVGGDAWFEAERKKLEIPKIEFGIAAPDAATQQQIDAAVKALRAKGVLCESVAADTPALDVNASLVGSAFTDEDLPHVAALGPTLVWLNLARTGVTDAGLARIQALPELRRLSAANTGIGDAGIAALGTPQKLESLNVYGTKVTDAGVAGLGGWPALARVFAFSTAVTEQGGKALVAQKPGLVVDRGEYAAQRIAAAEREIAERKRREEPANEACLVNGEKPSREHFVDVDGIRLVFCCGKCKKKYEADPSAFADKVAELRKQREAQATQQQAGEQKSGQRP